MKDNIKTKNIKLNLSIDEDKTIYDYFDENKVNFSKLTKRLLLKYIENKKEDMAIKEANEPVIEILKHHTKLLNQIIGI